MTKVAKATSSPRHILPRDLANAISGSKIEISTDYFPAVLAEQKRRGRNIPAPDKGPPNRQTEPVPLALTSGKLIAVRAAFKAGITPSRIARQFGISREESIGIRRYEATG